MEKNNISFVGLTVAPNQRIHGWVPVLDTGYEMPVTVINGAFEGPTLLITSGVHGGEYPGIQTALELSNELDPAALHGQVAIIHPVNLRAFYERVSYCVLEDGKNINRVFPGKKDGTLAEQIAYVVSTEFQAKADAYLDLHGGDLHEQLPPYVYYAGVEDEAVMEKAIAMAEVVECAYLVKSFNYGGAMGSATKVYGVPALLIERGGRGLWTPEEVADYKRNIHNVLCYLGIEKGKAVFPEKKPIKLSADITLTAEKAGAWYPAVQLGDSVKAGQVLGEVRDMFGSVQETLVAEKDALVIYMVVSLAVSGGAPLISLGVV